MIAAHDGPGSADRRARGGHGRHVRGAARACSPDLERRCGKPQVVLGVGGGIAAYKACELLRRLTESGHDVRVVPTRAALRFVGGPPGPRCPATP